MERVFASVDPGALMSRSYPLPGGVRVRLRLARPSDAARVRELALRDIGVATPLGLERALRYDPRTRIAICATTPRDGREEIVGFGAIGMDPDDAPVPLVVDSTLGPELGGLLTDALIAAARARARRAA